MGYGMVEDGIEGRKAYGRVVKIIVDRREDGWEGE